MRVIVVGGTGTLGSAIIKELSSRHEVLAVGKTNGALQCDIESERSIRELFEKVGTCDALISAAGKVHFDALESMAPSKYALGLQHKLMGQVNLVLIGLKFLRDGGSFTLTSGVLNRDPIRTGSSAAMVNGAIEGFVKTAAIELPRGIRINAVSPTVLEESMPIYAPHFRGFDPIPATRAALAYSKSVEGSQTGQIYLVGHPVANH